MRIVLIFGILLSFWGCSLNQKRKAIEPQKKQEDRFSLKNRVKKPKKPEVVKPKQIVSDMVRGVIYSQKYNPKTKLWTYELSPKDIASDTKKLKTFTHVEKLNEVGDLVYVIFHKNDLARLKKMYLIEKGYEKPKESSSLKRTNAKKNLSISVPKTETLILK